LKIFEIPADNSVIPGNSRGNSLNGGFPVFGNSRWPWLKIPTPVLIIRHPRFLCSGWTFVWR